MTFTVVVKWPGPIHEGNGEGVFIVDERANEAQVDAMKTLVSGSVGGPWGILGWTWPTLHGPYPARYELTLNGVHSSVKAGELLEVTFEPIRNPVTGAEITPGAKLPQGLIVKEADFARSKTFKVADGIELDYSDRYTAIGRFSYSGA